MQRNWDVVRKILIKLEELGTTTSFLHQDQVNGYDPELVAYHMQLLGEADLIKANCHITTAGLLECAAHRMTWKGHEFLDHIRQDTVWNQVKRTAREKGIDLSIDVIVNIAKTYISSMLE